jgi:hypothetical protein
MAAMSAYVAMHGRRVRPLLTTGAERLFEIDRLVRDAYLRHSSVLMQHFDRLLIDTLVEHGAGRRDELRTFVDGVRAKEWSVTQGGEQQLLRSEWQASFACRNRPMTTRMWYRAHTPISAFSFVVEGNTPLSIGITIRAARFFHSDGPAVLMVNGQEIARLPIEERWRTSMFALPHGALRPGVNDLEIHWAGGTPDTQAAITFAAAELEAGRLAELVPAFGDIHSLWISAGTPRASAPPASAPDA